MFRWLALAAAAAAFLWFLPLFHVMPLEAARREAALGEFDAATFVESYWDGPLRESAEQATDAGELLAALRHDFTGAADRFGHRLGLGGKIAFFVSGTGRISAVDGRTVTIALQENGPAQIQIRTGPVFGNAIRDGSGLFDVSEFTNVQDFNAVSAEINRRVEAQVLPQLEAIAGPGATLRFAGGVELADSGEPPDSLNVVPLLIETR